MNKNDRHASGTVPGARLEALRARVRALESGPGGGPGRRAVLPLGAPGLDAHLPGGGLPLAGLHEIAGERAEWDDGAALGFALALLSRVLAARPGPLLWVAARLDLYAPALAAAGIDAGRLILVRAGDEVERLWALEEGLRAGAFSALLGELAALDRTAGRRLQLAAETAGAPCFVLQRQLVGLRRAEAPSAALTRWRVAPRPSSPVETLAQLPGRPRWRVELLRCRGAAPADFLVEWNDATGDFGLVAPLRDGSLDRAPASPRAAYQPLRRLAG